MLCCAVVLHCAVLCCTALGVFTLLRGYPVNACCFDVLLCALLYYAVSFYVTLCCAMLLLYVVGLCYGESRRVHARLEGRVDKSMYTCATAFEYNSRF